MATQETRELAREALSDSVVVELRRYATARQVAGDMEEFVRLFLLSHPPSQQQHIAREDGPRWVRTVVAPEEQIPTNLLQLYLELRWPQASVLVLRPSPTQYLLDLTLAET